jgi:hypothetical protein
MTVEFLRRVVRHSTMLFLTTHGFSATSLDEAEPAALAWTVYHVFAAWMAVTAARVRGAARSLGDFSLGRPFRRHAAPSRFVPRYVVPGRSCRVPGYLPAVVAPACLEAAPASSRENITP